MEQFATFIRETGPAAVAIGGLLVGVFVGLVVRMTNFCSMGALSDIHAFGDSRRFRAWMLAIAVAIAGVWALGATGTIDFSRAMYLPPMLPLGGAIVGGLLFGVGMVFAGGCVTRNLVRVGGGDLRSIVTVLLTGMFAYMTIGGLLGPVRMALFGPLQVDLGAMGLPNQSIGSALAGLTGLGAGTAATIAALSIAVALAIWALMDARFRASRRDVAAGLLLGLAVVAGWMLTGLAYDEFAAEPVALESLTFVRPAGDLMNWLMRYTAAPIPDFGVTTTLGVIAGGFLGALVQRRILVTGFADRSDFLRVLGGSALMGIGGVLALGCTLGQGMTGVSTLAIGSFVALGAIIAGGLAGLRLMERMMENA